MIGEKIDLKDLTNLEDGTVIEVNEDDNNPVYALIKEEIEDFVSKPKTKDNIKQNFYNTIPESNLQNSIQTLLKTKSVKEERIRKHMQFEFDRKMQRINRIKSKTYRRMRRRQKLRMNQKLEEENEIISGSESTANEDNNESKEVENSENEYNINPVLNFGEENESEEKEEIS